MRDLIFLTIGMLIGGTVGALMLCMLQISGRSGSVDAGHKRQNNNDPQA